MLTENIVVHHSDDSAKFDMELWCDECKTHLCDVEDDDTLLVLVSVAEDHTCGQPDEPEPPDMSGPNNPTGEGR